MTVNERVGGIVCALLAALVLAACGGGAAPETAGMEALRGIEGTPSAEAFGWKDCGRDASCGAIVYVPIYSSVFHQEGKTLNLTATLSVHNVDLAEPIRLVRVRYYDTDGRPLRDFLEEPLTLDPLQTRHFLITQRDTSGGTGANFLVQWTSDLPVVSPVVEAVMISTTSQQGLSFTTQGKVVETLPGAAVEDLVE